MIFSVMSIKKTMYRLNLNSMRIDYLILSCTPNVHN